jgi:RNA polymerase sigma-70 factor (ECF subfamily)
MTTESLPARSEDKISTSIEEVYKKYNKMIYQVSFSYMKNPADAEDIVADVFVNLIKTGVKFQSDEHEKAWLLRTAINLCKNNLKHWRRKSVDIDECENLQSENQFNTSDTLKAVMELPDRYKAAIYLYYYEGYSTAEIARILKKPQSSVRVHLHEARKLLKEVLAENEE